MVWLLNKVIVAVATVETPFPCLRKTGSGVSVRALISWVETNIQRL